MAGFTEGLVPTCNMHFIFFRLGALVCWLYWDKFGHILLLSFTYFVSFWGHYVVNCIILFLY